MAPRPNPTPAPTPHILPRQAASSTSFVTVASVITAASIGSLETALPLDTNTRVLGTGTGATAVSFKGVGGTLTIDTLTKITTSTSTDIPTGTPAAAVSSGKTIPVGAVVAAFCVVAGLCVLLIAFFWWKRRKLRREAEEDRHHRRHVSERNKSFVGGHGLDGEHEGEWEEFKGNNSSSLHVPGSLPSPTSVGKLSYLDSAPESRLLNKISASSTITAPPRRLSVKSTLTGKVNPSNNFADEDYDDAKSTRSRHPMTPSAFPGLRALAPPPKMENSTVGGEPVSFVAFQSGGETELQQPFSFPPQPQQTPTPTRVPTQKSHRGRGQSSSQGHGQSSHGHGQSQHGHIMQTVSEVGEMTPPSPKRKNTKDESVSSGHNMIALTNLIAALDTPENPDRKSFVSQQSAYEGISPIEPHAIPSPGGQITPMPNPFDAPRRP